MTKEQEEAIDYVQKQIDYFKKQIKFIEAVDRTYYAAEYELYKNRVKKFETVLNMLKEKDEKIAKYEKIYKEYDCYRWVKELEKKDKMIDLMAEQLAGLTIWDNDKEEPLILADKEDVIKYFERKE